MSRTGGSDPPWIGRVLQQTYRVERLLGEGGMGAVFEASHARLRRRFAIKVLVPAVAAHPEAMARFRREAEITSELGHPHIVDIVDFNRTDEDVPYIVMELLEGESLEELLAGAGPLPVPRALHIFRQVASALDAAHRRGIVHRDLKPQNIFVCKRDEPGDFVKVLDFGISKVIGSVSLITATHITMGTPHYMSPEQAEGHSAAVDARTDIYALGAILYCMLAGRPPFLGESIPALLYQVVHAEPQPLRSLRPAVGPHVANAVHRALAKEREARFPTAGQFVQALEAALEPGVGAGGSDPTLAPAAMPNGSPPAPAAPASAGAGAGAESAAVPPSRFGAAGSSIPVGATTLSGGAGEHVVPGGNRSRRAALIAVAALALVGGLVGGAVLLSGGGRVVMERDQRPALPAAAAASATAPAANAEPDSGSAKDASAAGDATVAPRRPALDQAVPARRRIRTPGPPSPGRRPVRVRKRADDWEDDGDW